MEELNRIVAERLISLKAFKLQPSNPFAWAYGGQSPVYFDSRKLLSYPRLRNMLKVELSSVVGRYFPEADAIAAVATNAIAIGMLVAETLGLPFIYVRPKPKDHGIENQIEGELKPHQKVVIIDDQLSFGENCSKVYEVLVNNGVKVIGLAAILSYDLKEGMKRIEATGMRCYFLTHFSDVVDKALELNRISEEDAENVRALQKNPAKWKKK